MNATSASLDRALLRPVRLRHITWNKFKWLASLLSPVLLLLAWTLVTRGHWFSDRILVPPRDVYSAFLELCDSGELLEDLKISSWRLACGFGLGALGGLILGVLLEKS